MSMLNKKARFTHRNTLSLAIECQLSCAQLGPRFLAQVRPAQLESFSGHDSYRRLAGLKPGSLAAAIERRLVLGRHRPHEEKLQVVPISDN